MKADNFFENYAKLECLWQNFLSKNLTCSSKTALGMTAMRICYYITHNPHCALKEIALSLNISLGSASQMVQTMTLGGLIQCSSNKDDKRRISLIALPVLQDFFKNMDI